MAASQPSNNNNSKKFLASLVTALSISSSSMSTPLPAFAAVGEGDLPDGILAFSKVRKYQKDWDKLADSVKTRGNDMDDKEKLGIKLFLKQLSNEYYDMELLTTGVVDADKKSQAISVAKDLRAKVRAIDDSITVGASLDKFQELYPETKKELSQFFELLQDVPDEL